MKDYYQILGVLRSASPTEISTAYNKLADKFRPEAIQGDEFFLSRLTELEEAYSILSNLEKRKAYNEIYDFKFNTEPVDAKSETPIISVFESNKKAVKTYELINLRWQTIYADFVFIDHVGKVETEGTRSFRLPEYFQGEKFVITIIATNGSSNKKSTKKIEIVNKSFIENKELSKELSQDKNFENPITIKDHQNQNISKEEIVIKPSKSLTSKKLKLKKVNENSKGNKIRTSDIYVYVMLFVLVLFVLIMLVVAYNLNPF